MVSSFLSLTLGNRSESAHVSFGIDLGDRKRHMLVSCSHFTPHGKNGTDPDIVQTSAHRLIDLRKRLFQGEGFSRLFSPFWEVRCHIGAEAVTY